MEENDLNIQIRKFLKQVGIKSHREIDEGIKKAQENGSINADTPIKARMILEIESLQISTVIEGTLQ